MLPGRGHLSKRREALAGRATDYQICTQWNVFYILDATYEQVGAEIGAVGLCGGTI